MAEDIVFDVIGRDRASSTFDKVGKSSSGAMDKLKKFAAVGALAFAAAGIAAVKFGADSIGAASDLNETLSKSKIIFGENFKAVDKWAKGGAKSMGLSRQAALEAAAGFGDMFSQIGFANDAAARMSRSVVQMSADLGSFNNLPTADVAERISAAFRGEYDSLQTLIPNINAARVEQAAMAETGKKNAKELTAQEKAAAVLAIVHKDGARAMGDFARTSDGLANQQKILGAQFENVKAKIGRVLLPAMVAIVTFTNNVLIPAFGKIPGFVKTAIGKIRAAFDRLNLGPVAARIKSALGKINISGIGSKLATQAKAWAAPVIEGFKTGLDTGDWSGLGKALGNGILRALEGLGELVGKFGKIFSDLMGKVDWVGIGIAMGKQAPSLLLGLAAGILNFDLMGLLEGVAKHWQDILLAVLAVAFTPVKIIGKVGELLARIPLVGKLLQWGLTHFKKFADGLVGMVGKALGALGRAFMSGFRRVFPTVGRAFGEALKLLPTRLGIIALDLQAKGLKMLLGLAKAIGKGIVWVVEKIGELIGRILKPFADAATWLVKKGVDIISGLMGGIRKKVAAVWSFFKGIGAKILSAVSNFGSLLFAAGKALIEGLINGIKSMAGALGGVLKDIGGGAVNTVKGVFGIHSPSKVFHGIGVDLIRGLVDGIDSKRVSVRTVLEKLTAYISRQTDKIATLMGKRSDIINSFKDFGSSVFNMEPPEGQKSTAETLLAYQKQQLNKALRLKRDVARLLKMGLSRSLIEQMAASGESGMEQIHALTQGSSAQVAQLNSLNAQTNQALAAAGTMAGNSLYASDIKDAKRDKAVAVAMAQEFRKVLREEKGDLHVYVEIDGHQLHTVLLREKKKQGKGLNLG